MRIIVRLVLIAVLVALGWWLWTVVFPGPAKVVRQRINTLAQAATFTDKDSIIARAAKAQKVSDLFSSDVTIDLNVSGYGARQISGHDELSESVTSTFAAIRGLKVEFLDVTVTVAPDKQSADVDCTAKMRFEDSKDYGVTEMRFHLKKTGNGWLISHAETVKTFS